MKSIDYRAVFAGIQDNEHKENIRKAANGNARNWMRHTSDEYIDAFAAFVIKMSSYIENEAHKYGFVYIEMSKVPFNGTLSIIVNPLLAKNKR